MMASLSFQQDDQGTITGKNCLVDAGKEWNIEIHLIKKPVVTEESKKIQERLNKYYQSKRREENTQKAEASKAAKE